MEKRSMKLAMSIGLLMVPMMAAMADAPIVQGHPAQSLVSNATPVATNAPAVSTSAAAPLDASKTTQTPDQALVTGASTDNNGSSAAPASSLDIGNQIAMLQQQVQDLRGQLEVQGHTITQLQAQVAQLSSGKTTQAVMAALPASATPAAAVTAPVASASPAAPQNATAATTAQPAATTPAQAGQTSELQLYQQAYNLMAAKQYTQATVALQSYLQQYPNGQYAANSHYWLGELALIGGNPTQAQSQFNIVVSQFDTSPKAADSALKLGMIFYEQQQWQQAKAQFNAVIKQYPNTTTAQLAQQQLQQIQQSGN